MSIALQEKKEIVIEKMTRNKRKCITTIKGLDLFGMLCFQIQCKIIKSLFLFFLPISD